MTMIVVEGVDNTGKTTLAKFLAEQLGFVYMHNPGPPNEQTQPEWVLFIEDSLLDVENRVYDRHPIISEAVYGPILRDKDTLKGTGYIVRLVELNPIIIYCRPPASVIENTILDREQLEGVADNLGVLLDVYDDYIAELENLSNLEIYFYDYSHPRALEYCMRWVKEQLGE